MGVALILKPPEAYCCSNCQEASCKNPNHSSLPDTSFECNMTSYGVRLSLKFSYPSLTHLHGLRIRQALVVWKQMDMTSISDTGYRKEIIEETIDTLETWENCGCGEYVLYCDHLNTDDPTVGYMTARTNIEHYRNGSRR